MLNMPSKIAASALSPLLGVAVLLAANVLLIARVWRLRGWASLWPPVFGVALLAALGCEAIQSRKVAALLLGLYGVFLLFYFLPQPALPLPHVRVRRFESRLLRVIARTTWQVFKWLMWPVALLALLCWPFMTVALQPVGIAGLFLYLFVRANRSADDLNGAGTRDLRRRRLPPSPAGIVSYESPERGGTLIETVAACGLVLVAMTMVTSTLVAARKAERQAEDRLVAINALDGLMERARAGQVALRPAERTPITAPGLGQLPNSKATLTCRRHSPVGLLEVRVDATWRRPGDAPRQATLTTLVSQP